MSMLVPRPPLLLAAFAVLAGQGEARPQEINDILGGALVTKGCVSARCTSPATRPLRATPVRTRPWPYTTQEVPLAS